MGQCIHCLMGQVRAVLLQRRGRHCCGCHSADPLKGSSSVLGDLFAGAIPDAVPKLSHPLRTGRLSQSILCKASPTGRTHTRRISTGKELYGYLLFPCSTLPASKFAQPAELVVPDNWISIRTSS